MRAVKAVATAEKLTDSAGDERYKFWFAEESRQSAEKGNDELKDASDGFGSISGQFILDGPIPETQSIIRKGDSAVKDSKCCAAQELFSRAFVVNGKSKGIRHIFVYMRRTKVIHPDLKNSNEQEVVFDQKHCRFEPHTLLIRTDQTVVLKSGDPIVHNAHWIPIRNQSFNVLLAMNDRRGHNVACNSTRLSELLPMPVKCDIHPWMKAYWLVLDHPYMAITDPDGKFQIERIPEGVHEITVWHERIGYLDTKKDVEGNPIWNVQRNGVDWSGRKCMVTVKSNSVTEFGEIKIPSARFEDAQ